MEAASSALNRAAEWLMAVLLALMALVTGLAIAGRFVFSYSLFWSDEATRFLLIWIAFLGMSVGVRRGAHPGIDSLVRALRPGLGRFLCGIAVLASSLFFVVAIVYGTALARTAWLQRSPSLGVRMAWPYAAVPVAGLLMLLHGLAVGGQARSDSEGPHHG